MKQTDVSEHHQLFLETMTGFLNPMTGKYVAAGWSEPLKQPDDHANPNLLKSHDITSLAELDTAHP